MSRVTEKGVEKCRELFKSIPRSKGNLKPIYDGIVDLKKYNNAQYKIMWILKEVSGSNNKGGWDICEDFLKDNKFKEYSRWKATLAPIIYASYGILHELPTWGKLPEVEDISSILEHIAYINLKKTHGGTTSHMPTIKKAYSESQELIHCQIKTYKPDIIIGGKTLDILYPYFNISDADLHTEVDDSWYSISEGRLLIDAWHPAQRGITHETYYSAIRTTVRKGLRRLENSKK